MLYKNEKIIKNTKRANFRLSILLKCFWFKRLAISFLLIFCRFSWMTYDINGISCTFIPFRPIFAVIYLTQNVLRHVCHLPVIYFPLESDLILVGCEMSMAIFRTAKTIVFACFVGCLMNSWLSCHFKPKFDLFCRWTSKVICSIPKGASEKENANICNASVLHSPCNFIHPQHSFSDLEWQKPPFAAAFFYFAKMWLPITVVIDLERTHWSSVFSGL